MSAISAAVDSHLRGNNAQGTQAWRCCGNKGYSLYAQNRDNQLPCAFQAIFALQPAWILVAALLKQIAVLSATSAQPISRTQTPPIIRLSPGVLPAQYALAAETDPFLT